MTDLLYAALGVPRDATKNEIRRAYRTKAKSVHPDKMNGDRAAFETLKMAHDILIDDERRAHYDATGQYEEVKPDNNRAEAVMRAVTAVQNAVVIARSKVGRCLTGPGNPLSLDILALAKNNLVDHIGQVEAQKAEFDERAKFQADLISRFKKDGGEDVIGAALRSGLVDAANAIKSCEAEIAATNAALQLFDGYTFERDTTAVQSPAFTPAFGYTLRSILSDTPP